MKTQEDYVHVFVHLKLAPLRIIKVICIHGSPQDWETSNPSNPLTAPSHDSTTISLHLKFAHRKFARLLPIMNILAQQFLNRAAAKDKDDDHYSRSSSHDGAVPLMAGLAALGRAVGVRGGEERRGRERFQRMDRVNLQRLGEYVVDMMEKKDEKKDESERRRRHGEGKRRKRRRRHSHDEDSSNSSKAHTKEQDQPSPKHHSHSPRDLQNTTNPNYPYMSIPTPSHRHRRDTLELNALKTELEAMSDTLTDLNSRSASHTDCEFYEKFVETGGKLQERIGETLGRIGEVERKKERRRRRKSG